MATAEEWAIRGAMALICKALGLDPQETGQHLAKTMQIIVEAGQRMERLEAQNLAIMAALGITPEQQNAERKPTECGILPALPDATPSADATAPGYANGSGERT